MYPPWKLTAKFAVKKWMVGSWKMLRCWYGLFSGGVNGWLEDVTHLSFWWLIRRGRLWHRDRKKNTSEVTRTVSFVVCIYPIWNTVNNKYSLWGNHAIYHIWYLYIYIWLYIRIHTHNSIVWYLCHPFISFPILQHHDQSQKMWSPSQSQPGFEDDFPF